jgi:hypothetical protein
MDDPQNVALAEDPDQASALIKDGKRPDVVLDELGNGFADGRIAIDCNDPSPFGFEDISDQHEPLPDMEHASVANDSKVHPATLSTAGIGSVTWRHRDIFFLELQILF